MSDGALFSPFTNLSTLFIDDNLFSSLQGFPVLHQLETFSANKNNFSDLALFLEESHDKFGNIRNISLLKNPINPFFDGEEKYNIYQNQFMNSFPSLKTLDGITIKIMKLSMT